MTSSTSSAEILFGEQRAAAVNLADWRSIQIEPIRWLMLNLVPLAELTIVEGPGGVGKTTAMLDIMARLSRGEPMPDGTPPQPASNALLIASEEDRVSLLKAKLIAAGADLARIGLVESIGTDQHWFSLPSDAPAILDAVRKRDARFVFIDALFSHFGDGLSSNKPQDVRGVLRPLSALAHETGAAVIAIRHWGKTARAAMDRGLGSADIRNVARSVLTIGPHPAETETRRYVVAVAKANLGPAADALTYSIESARIEAPLGTVEVARVAWGDRARISADDLANAALPSAEEQTRVEIATDLLSDALSDGNTVPSEDLYALAKHQNISPTCLKRAAKRLGIIHERSGFPSRSTWRLRQSDQQSDHAPTICPTGLSGPTATLLDHSDHSDQIDHTFYSSRAHAREEVIRTSLHGKLCSLCRRIGICVERDGRLICTDCLSTEDRQ